MMAIEHGIDRPIAAGSDSVRAFGRTPDVNKERTTMVDVQVEPAAAEDVQDFISKVELKGGVSTEEINFSALPDEAYKMLLVEGVKAFAEKANGAAKLLTGITKLEGKELEARKAEIKAAVDKTIEQIKAGIQPGAKKTKTSGAVQTEAMRLAKNMVKDLIRNSGQKIGAYSAKELTAAAKLVLERNPHIVKLAEKNLAERASEAKGSKSLDLKGLFGAKADSEEVKAKPKAPPKRKGKAEGQTLSAAQAGKVAPRQKPGVGHTAH
jgi:hypothetical protein